MRIGGGSTDRQRAFYTALYHAQLHPNLAGDVDGRYTRLRPRRPIPPTGSRRTRTSRCGTPTARRTSCCELLQPKVARDVALSVVAIGRDGGWLPRWALANSETNIMTGDPVTPFLVEAWSKGLLAGPRDRRRTRCSGRTRPSTPPADSPVQRPRGHRLLRERGYIPFGLALGKDCADKGGDNDCHHPASATLEYAAADASLALMAKALGHTADARDVRRRAASGTATCGTPRIGQFRPRTTDGTWLTPYDPVEAGHQFHEGGAYQYQWLVPQDPAGLVALMGGRRPTEKRLDAFFAYDKLLTDPAGTARDDWISAPYDYYGKPTYNPNNEPDLLAPYMYLWAGAPAKTATVVRAAMTLFTNGPDGMTGNDDLGTMSAWYVFSSLGLYPTMSGADFLAALQPAVPVGGHPDRRPRDQAGRHADGHGTGRERRPALCERASPAARTCAPPGWTGTRSPTAGDCPSADRRAVGVGYGQGAEPPSVNARGSRFRAGTSTRRSEPLPTSYRRATVRNGPSAAGRTGPVPGTLRVGVRATAPRGWTVKTAEPFPLCPGGCRSSGPRRWT